MNDSAKDQGRRLDAANLAQLTKDVVVAYTSNNATAVSELVDLIRTVGDRLSSLDQARAPAHVPAKPEPAVSVRRSVSPDHLTCLVCGRKQKMLKRHLSAAHNMTPSTYRELFELRSDYPMIAPSYAEQRSAVAKRIGLGRAWQS